MMGSSLYPDRLWISIVWILTILLTADGSSITWYEPPPIQTLLDSRSDPVGHLANSTQLLEGSINASISWNFSLSSDLSFSSLTVSLGGTVIAGVVSSGPGVQAGFKDKFDIRWIPFQRVTLIIFNVTTEVNGTFGCDVAAAKGFGTSNFGSIIQVHVVDPPSNIVTSRNITVTAPDELTLNCSADGKPRPTRTWTRLSDNTVVTMPLNITGKQDAGGYRCTVDNGVGTPLTKDVFITVRVHPKIDYVSSDWDICENSTVILSCNATGEPTPNITWKRVADDEILPAVDGVYVIDNIKRNGRYSCKADNGVGIDSKTVNVTVRFAASIDGIINSSNTVNEGGFFSMTCQASNNTLPTNYTWINKDGLLFNESVLSFSNISRAEAGQYRCEVKNRCGMDGRNTYVNVYYKPDVVILKSNTTENENCSEPLWVNFTCLVSEANPKVDHYELYKNGNKIKSGNSQTWIEKSEQGKHNYSCEALHPVQDVASLRIEITVYALAQVNVDIFGNLTLVEGGSVLLYCKAQGFPSPTSIWTKGGDSAFIERDSWMNFSSITRDMHGNYSCHANNSCGKKSSPITSIDVQYKPLSVVLNKNVSSNRACTRDVIKFTCTAVANPAVDSYLLHENDTFKDMGISGITTKVLNAHGRFIYWCQASNVIGTNRSNGIVLKVEDGASVINVHTSPTSIKEGDNVTFSCDLSGSPTPNVSWVFNKNHRVVERNANWSLPNINRKDSGEYKCKAVNTCGNESKGIFVNVQYQPENVTISTNASSDKFCTGMVVKLTCRADANPAVESYVLYENGALAESNKGQSTKQYNDGGQFIYRCVANNSIGTDNVAINFTVQVRPSLTIQEEIIFANEGDSVTLNCSASGSPYPSVTWMNSKNESYNTEMWLLRNISRAEAGNYTCRASNPCGIDNKLASIYVRYRPYVIDYTATIRAVKGGAAFLPCPVDGYPKPVITWYKENGAVVSSESVLRITSAATSDSGWYTCFARNVLGNVTARLKLEVLLGEPTSATPISTEASTKQVHAEMTIEANYTEGNQVSKKFVKEMDEIYKNDTNYNKTEVTGVRNGSIIVSFILYFNNAVTPSQGISKLEAAIANGRFGDYEVGKLTLLSPGTSTVTSTTHQASKPTVEEGLPWTIIAAIAGSVLLVAFVVALVTWWVHKKRKCIKDTKIHNSECEESLHGDSPNAKVNRAYAESGPPSASGTQQSQDLGAIPTYAVVDKSKKKKKKEEKPPIYATVDKSKKRKKKTDDKNLYDNVEEPKKERKPGEVLYAELGDFQNPAMPEVSTSPATLPPLRRPPSYEQTQYADITAFLKGDATLPQKEGNEGSEMQEQGANQSQHDVDNKETPM